MKTLLYTSSLLLVANQMTVAQEQPNIIIFLVDDMGVMDTSLPFLTDSKGNAVRHPQNDWFRTPNMEKMGKQGIRFSTFYAQSVSSPSRASLLTGQNSTRHRTTNWINSESNNRSTFGPRGWNWSGLTSSDVTLPRVLQQSGYKTIHIGKAHFGCIGSEGENPLNVGFDVNIGGSSIGQPGSYYGENGYGHIKGNKQRAVPSLEKYHNTNTYLTEALTLEAIAQIDRAVIEEKPFFLYMAHYAVHAPWEADPRFSKHYQYSEKSAQAKAFATIIEGMDKSLGDILIHIEELDIAENTLILFIGDNGSDAPSNDDKGYTSSAPLRGKKGTEYEGGVRVPFIASWGKPSAQSVLQKQYPIKSGEIQHQLGTIMDVYPTLLSVAGVQNPQGHIVDGVDLKTQLLGRTSKTRSEKVLMHFPHEHRSSYFTTYREGNWKLIYFYNPEKPTQPKYRLYNLKRDPAESLDLSDREDERLKTMIEAMSRQLESEDACFPEDEKGAVLKPFYRK